MQIVFVIFVTILTFVISTDEISASPISDSTIEDKIDTSIEEDYVEAYMMNITAMIKKKYAKALELSFLFFEAQRSGKLPKDNRIPWRGDSAMLDRGHNGEDLTGGYYNFGTNYMKYISPTAFTTTILAWGLLTWPDGYREASQLDAAYKAIKWATDYFIKCHTKQNEFYILVGSRNIEKNYWGRPEDMNHTRRAYKANSRRPASDVLGETAAALAAASIVFRDVFSNISYSEECLKHAEQLYIFATKYNDSKSDRISHLSEDYTRGYNDDLAWASIWLYKATMNITYFTSAMKYYMSFDLTEIYTKTFCYQDKVAGIQMMAAQMTKQTGFTNAVKTFCNLVVNHTRTPKDLVYLSDSDTLPLAANAAFLCLVAVTSGIDDDSNQYYTFAKQQIDYMLETKTGRSYVVGYNTNSPKQPRHLASSCPSKPAPCGWDEVNRNVTNPQTLYGALVSGPNANDAFRDYRNIRVNKPRYTDVKIENNAGFTGALAGLLQLENNKRNQSDDSAFPF